MDDLNIKDSSLRQEISDFKSTISQEALALVTDTFPRKCIMLDKLLREEHLQLSKASEVYSALNIPVPEPLHLDDEVVNKKRKLSAAKGDTNHVNEKNTSATGTKVFAILNGSAPCNAKLTSIIDKIKPEIRELIEKCNTVRMWVTLLIPKIEDGNNFGVSIQEDTLAELRQVESEAASFLDQISRYFITRAKIVTKVSKYPHVEDYRRFVIEIDEKEFLSLRLIICELRNHYSVLHDMILKNIEKIKKPRTTNLDAMY